MLRNVIAVTSGTDVQLLVGTPARRSTAWRADIWRLSATLYPARHDSVSSGVLIVRVVRIRDRRTPIDVTLLLWLLVHANRVYADMDSGMASLRRADDPAPFVVVGAAAADLWRGLSRRIVVRRAVFAAGAVTLALIVIAQGWLQGTLLQYVATHDTNSSAQMSFGTPLSDLMPARNAHPGAASAERPRQSRWSVRRLPR